MNADNFNVDLNNTIAFLLNQIAENKTEITFLKSLISVLLDEHPRRSELFALLQEQHDTSKEKVLQLLLESLHLESVEMKQMIESFLKKP